MAGGRWGVWGESRCVSRGICGSREKAGKLAKMWGGRCCANAGRGVVASPGSAGCEAGRRLQKKYEWSGVMRERRRSDEGGGATVESEDMWREKEGPFCCECVLRC